MNAFSDIELERMQATQESAMMDLAQVLTRSAGTGDYGYGPATYLAGRSIACGFDPKPREVMGDTQVEMSDGTLRLPIGTAVTHLDRVKITRRFGSVVPAQTYEIMGQPARGPSGLVLNLRRVTDGSDA